MTREPEYLPATGLTKALANWGYPKRWHEIAVLVDIQIARAGIFSRSLAIGGYVALCNRAVLLELLPAKLVSDVGLRPGRIVAPKTANRLRPHVVRD